MTSDILEDRNQVLSQSRIELPLSHLSILSIIGCFEDENLKSVNEMIARRNHRCQK